MRVQRTDFFLGLGAVVLSVTYLQLDARIPESLLADAVGAAGLPRLVGWAVAIVGVLLCVRSFSRGANVAPQEAVEASENGAGHPRPHLRALGLLAILAGYVVLAPWLGYAVATGLLVAVGAAYAGAPLGRNLVLISVLAGLGFWVMFVLMFGIPMPGSALLGG